MNRSVVGSLAWRTVPAGIRIDQRRERRRLRQQRGAVGRAGREALQSLVQTLAERFEGSKEEGLVLQDRSAEIAAELVQAERLLLDREGIAGVEDVIAQELEQIAMIRVCAAGRSHDDLRARSDAGFGGNSVESTLNSAMDEVGIARRIWVFCG